MPVMDASELIATEEEEARRRLLRIEGLDGVLDADKLNSLRRLEHVLRAVMLVVAGRMGARPAAG